MNLKSEITYLHRLEDEARRLNDEAVNNGGRVSIRRLAKLENILLERNNGDSPHYDLDRARAAFEDSHG